jgi:hypothetical protein
MQRIQSRTYLGQPNETVTVKTQASGGGVSNVILNNAPVGPSARFPLPPNPGDQLDFQVQLTGPLGASCVVSISDVGGGSDSDFLMCQTHNPVPVNTYRCSVGAPIAVNEFAAAKALAPLAGPPTKAKKAKKKATAAKSKKGKKKGGGK